MEVAMEYRFLLPWPCCADVGVGKGCALKATLLLDTAERPSSVTYRKGHIASQLASGQRGACAQTG